MPVDLKLFNPECPTCNDEMKRQGVMYVSSCGFSAPEDVAKAFKAYTADFSKLFGGFDLGDVLGGKR